MGRGNGPRGPAVKNHVVRAVTRIVTTWSAALRPSFRRFFSVIKKPSILSGDWIERLRATGFPDRVPPFVRCPYLRDVTLLARSRKRRRFDLPRLYLRQESQFSIPFHTLLLAPSRRSFPPSTIETFSLSLLFLACLSLSLSLSLFLAPSFPRLLPSFYRD